MSDEIKHTWWYPERAIAWCPDCCTRGIPMMHQNDRQCGNCGKTNIEYLISERAFGTLRAEVERLRAEPKASDVLSIRCTKHYAVPRQNTTEHSGGECGGCIAKERDAAIARAEKAEAELAALKGETERREREAFEAGRSITVDDESPQGRGWTYKNFDNYKAGIGEVEK